MRVKPLYTVSVVQTLAAWWDLSLACSSSLSCAGQRSEYQATVGLVCRFCFSFQDEDCSVFKKEYCSLRLDKIMMLDTDIAGPAECQVRCRASHSLTLIFILVFRLLALRGPTAPSFHSSKERAAGVFCSTTAPAPCHPARAVSVDLPSLEYQTAPLVNNRPTHKYNQDLQQPEAYKAK